MIPPEQSSKHKFHVTSQITMSAAKNRLSVKVTYPMSITGSIFQNSRKSQQPHSIKKQKTRDSTKHQKEQSEDEKKNVFGNPIFLLPWKCYWKLTFKYSLHSSNMEKQHSAVSTRTVENSFHEAYYFIYFCTLEQTLLSHLVPLAASYLQ